MKKPLILTLAAAAALLAPSAAHAFGMGGIAGLLKSGGSGSPFQQLKQKVMAARTATVVAAWTPTETPTFTDSPTVTVTGTRTASPTSTATPTYTATPTASPTSTVTPTATPTGTPTASPTATPSVTVTSTYSFSPTVTSTGTPTASPTATPTDTVTSTYSFSPTATLTSTPTGTPTASPSSTATGTFSFSPTGTSTASPTGTPTASPTGTGTLTATRTSTGVFSPTATSTITQTFTITPTPGPTTIAVVDEYNDLFLYKTGVWTGPVTVPNILGAQAIAYDSAGNLFIADNQSVNIEEYSNVGVWSAITGGVSAGTYSSYAGIAVDSSGSIYVSANVISTGNRDVLKINPVAHTNAVLAAGTGVLELYSDGTNVWGADNTTSKLTQFAGGSGSYSTAAAPQGMAFFGSNFYYTNGYSSAYNYPSGTPMASNLSGQSAYMAFDPSGKLYVTDLVDTTKIYMYNGSTWSTIPGPALGIMNASAGAGYPSGIAVH